MKWLLLCVPAALFLRWSDADPMLVFAMSLAAIIPLVECMGAATDHLAAKFGSTVGGLLNSTLANAPELIIGLVALSNGLGAVVKASLTGSIMVNLLVGLGISLVWGGLKYGPQRTDEKNLRVNTSMLMICAFCLIVPAVFKIGTPEGTRGLSTEISIVLLCIYCLNVGVTLFTRQPATGLLPDDSQAEHGPAWSTGKSLAVLAVSGGLLALVSDALSESLSPTAKQLGLSNTFSGIMLLGGVGGLARC